MAARVAVIIPTYNHAHYLAAAIDSALAQTVPPAEVIVVDDGSRDDPAAVTARYPTVKLIRQENQGLSAARNTGMRAADSEYLVFLDADDQLLPDALAKQLELFAQHPDCGMVYGSYCYVDAVTREITPAPLFPPGEDPFATFLRCNCIGMHATVMYRADRLEAVGAFDASLRACEDYDAYLRMSRNYAIAARPEMMAEYWQHDQNMSRDTAMMLRSVLGVVRRYRAAADERPEWRTAVREGEARWIRFYSDTWLMNLLENRKAAGLAPLMRQAVGITQISPRALPASAARMAIANTRRRVQSARSALRRRLAQRAGGPNGPA
ncbi:MULTISPECIES: glycosyltransferase family A protein [unclassified Phenylobacterium]|uniref:glycosyltransferase family 2 protein n=1 Tax=unclassified Phenylobacterium TaxID=2640670 RepID=UPI0022B4047E|nr:glycosyltransferase family A protein [Phenylobacterium sp. NIBR 498073]MBS0490533.1 glycosyltransferase family 2 protein [Pseudomonadota bacterium]WGU39578.1 glycosyltransferase family A protein [Phenylobacterium sp. NIBR 498073]